MIEIRATEQADIEAIIPRLRAHDRKTIEKLNLNPSRLLHDTLERASPMYTCLEDGAPMCMWGIEQRTLTSNYMLWMLTTEFVDRNPIRFLRESRRFVQWGAATYGSLIGVVDSEFEISIRWLRWLGFREVSSLGPYKQMRYP